MHRAPIRPATRDDHAQRVLRAWVHLGARLGEAHSLRSLARVAHLSPFHFQRVFARTTGETPATLLRRLRVERAARALLDGDAPIGRVVAAAGYGSLEAFHRAFRGVFGTAPSAWRTRRDAASGPVAAPKGLRVWVNRPGRDAQLRLVPVEPADGAGRGRRTGASRARAAASRSWRMGTAARARRGGFRTARRAAARRAARPRLRAPASRRSARDGSLRAGASTAASSSDRGGAARTIGVQSIGGGDHAVATLEGRAAVARVRAWLEIRAPDARAGARAGPLIEARSTIHALRLRAHGSPTCCAGRIGADARSWLLPAASRLP
jgi:AraC-like DNA-binding protein